MSGTEAGHHFRQGRLADAVAAAGRAVQQAPTDVAARLLLAEFLLFAAEFERADALVAAVEALDPDSALAVAEFRQLLRAETARRQLGTEGRLPDFVDGPTPDQEAALAMVVALRAGDQAAAAAAAVAAEAARTATRCVANDREVEDFRDADDLAGGSLEVLTTTGRYYWIPAARLVSMEFHPPRRPRDLFWRRCTMIVRDGLQGDVYLPALYDTPAAEDELRMGRRTEWSSQAPVRGCGQRIFLVGDEGLAITDLRTVEFA
ncbi:SciE type virulence protein [Methylobacterium variabile]|jgi:type VI secretion system protein ImpE|uniref:SciE type virulence protein n=1 Tax=Methylobacterium variabile TaxID=298794 RepID=A0A0J6SJM5_9HYPH|nr:type VI secretion system accessory protein TagJ [Methylobacterium variabile]KMO33553.1 SciE type virulence protein [Methylobacterium variabile]